MEAGGLELNKSMMKCVDISLPRNFYKGPRPHAEDHGILVLRKKHAHIHVYTYLYSYTY